MVKGAEACVRRNADDCAPVINVHVDSSFCSNWVAVSVDGIVVALALDCCLAVVGLVVFVLLFRLPNTDFMEIPENLFYE